MRLTKENDIDFNMNAKLPDLRNEKATYWNCLICSTTEWGGLYSACTVNSWNSYNHAYVINEPLNAPKIPHQFVPKQHEIYERSFAKQPNKSMPKIFGTWDNFRTTPVTKYDKL